MRFVPRTGFVLLSTWATLVVGLLVTNNQSAQARPDYKKGFDALYKEHYEKAETTAKCEVCHVKGDKKKRVEYGDAFGEALGEKKVKDMKKIEEALKKIEDKDSPVEGKKFIDLIKDGKYPSGNDPE